MKRQIKEFFRGFYVTVLVLCVLSILVYGVYVAKQNTENVGYGKITDRVEEQSRLISA